MTRQMFETAPSEPRDMGHFGGDTDQAWIIAIVLLPYSLTLALDACALPVTLPHDVYVACQ